MTHTLERLRHVLAGRYSIEREVGAGGMATVYLARDVKHKRSVALKVLRPEFSTTLGPERFLREIETAARLHHPHILPLHDSGEADGLLYYVMPFVEGQSLRQRLAEQGQLPLPDAVRILRDVVDALSEAHAQQVVHRDIKPENVLLRGRHALVTDFGLAKAVSESTEREQLTAQGVTVGTPAYMAPEQIAADRHIDHRVDLYAVGVLAYELLTGRTPFRADTMSRTLAAHLIETPPPVSAYRAGVPPELESAVMRCLAKDPSDRWASADELLHQLEGLLTSFGPATPAGVRTNATPIVTRRRWLAATAVVLGLSGIAAVWAASTDGETAAGAPVAPVQLTANPPERSVTGAAISPDGTYLAFTDSRGLHLQLLATNETHLVDVGVPVVPQNVWWFPDGRRLLFLGADTSGGVALWSVGIIGGRARRLLDDVLQAAVAPDGKQIAVLFGRASRGRSLGEVWLMGPDGTDARALVAPGARESFWHVTWTPDSRAVALGVWSDKGMTIELVPVAGGERQLLLSDPTLFQNWTGILPFTWCGDGRLVYGRRDGPPHQAISNVWVVDTDVATRVVRGTPRRVTQWTAANVRELSATADCAKIAVLQVRNQPDVYVGEIDASARAFRMERKLTLDERSDFPTGWAADGRRLLITSTRSGNVDVYVTDLTAEADDLEPLHRGPGDQRNAIFTPGGDTVLFVESGDIWTVPATGGGARMLVEGSFQDARCPRSPERTCVAGRVSGAEYIFSAFDPARGEVRDVARTAHRVPFTNWDLSPDGRRVAVVHNDDNAITIVRLDSGSEEVVRVDGWTNFEFVSWTARGDGFFVSGSAALGIGYPVLLHVDMQGRARVLRQHPHEWHVMPHASPDGRFVAFAKVSFHGNAWLVEGFR